MSGAMAILRLRLSTIPHSRPSSPRSRSAGEGPGVRANTPLPPQHYQKQRRKYHTAHRRGDQRHPQPNRLSPHQDAKCRQAPRLTSRCITVCPRHHHYQRRQ